MTTLKNKIKAKPPITKAELVKYLGLKFHVDSAEELAPFLGLSEAKLRNWETSTESLTARQLAFLVAQAHTTAQKDVHDFALKPIVECFPITPARLPNGDYEVFEKGEKGGRYLNGLYQHLNAAKSGLYIFYDSRGRALYVGQTKRQNIWKEMNLAFNRDRKDQIITLVRHPSRDVEFRRADEQDRQPRAKSERLHNLAAYFSAHEVIPNMVDKLEALLIRTFLNDITNVKMQRIGKKRMAAAKKTAANKK